MSFASKDLDDEARVPLFSKRASIPEYDPKTKGFSILIPLFIFIIVVFVIAVFWIGLLVNGAMNKSSLKETTTTTFDAKMNEPDEVDTNRFAHLEAMNKNYYALAFDVNVDDTDDSDDDVDFNRASPVDAESIEWDTS